MGFWAQFWDPLRLKIGKNSRNFYPLQVAMLTRRFWMEVKREGQVQMHKLFLEMLEASLGSGAIGCGGVIGSGVGVEDGSFTPGTHPSSHVQEMMQ